MKIAPDAAPDDGAVRGGDRARRVEVLAARWISAWSTAAAHKSLPSCTILRGKKIVVEPLGNLDANAALLDIDGESPGRIPATFEVIPAAITVRG